MEDMMKMEDNTKVMKVTTIEQLKEYSKGTIVELPKFADGQPFYARLKRPSLMNMVKCGKIPNSLLVRANELFVSDGGFDVDDEGMLTQMFDILDVIADSTFCEPTYKEIKDAGIELTDEQLIFLFNYSQKGIDSLGSFRTE
jgi:hypothetical protein